VEVEAEGKTVALAPEEAVEVRLGQAPGEKFAVKRDQVDYSKWNEEKLASMLADPDAAMANIEGRMASYIASVEEYAALYEEFKAKTALEREKRMSLQKEKGPEEARKYEDEVVMPIVVKASNAGLNLRYHALAALSLRRWVGGRLYAFQKAIFIASPGDAGYDDFLARYKDFLAAFELSIAPYLVEADI
jgi:hypothetical protein